MSEQTKIVIYRSLRTAVAAGVSSALLLQPDWTNPEQAFRILLVSFIAGFLTALGKIVRDNWGTRGKDSVIDRVMPI